MPTVTLLVPIGIARITATLWLQGRADELSAAVEGNGTSARPYPIPRGKVPISEFGSQNYTTAAFPTLFPFGKGDFSEVRDVGISWTQYSQHLMHYHDGRFARHDRFRYFMLNTHERQLAHEKASICIRDHKLRLTVGEVRALSQKSKEEIAMKVDRYGATLRNTPGFFRARRVELEAMIERLGDPHVFCTNSHADTYCPELQRFIKAWAKEDFVKATDDTPAGCSAAFDLDDPGLSDKEKSRRRIRNLQTYPHLVALFFHLKMELYLEHICRGILKADAHWARYEWQSRGSTHVHYFLWLSNAPEVTSVLDRWTSDAARSLFDLPEDEASIEATEDQLDQLVERLNLKAQHAAEISKRASASGKQLASMGVDELRAHAESALAAAGTPQPSESDVQDAIQVATAAEFWYERCGRWNHQWDEGRQRPDQPTVGFEAHACSKEPARVRPCVAARETRASACACCTVPHCTGCKATHCIGCDLPEAIANDINAVRNVSCRHTSCGPYCQRIDRKTGEKYCRFHFPQTPREYNENGVPYLYCERVKTGVRWRLYLPMNDPKMGRQNLWQLASQRANVDFSPLIDHECAVEYCTKYATKKEKTSQTTSKLLDVVLERVKARDDVSEGDSAVRLFASYLCQQVGGRDWSAQEVSHVNMGIRTVISSHDFIHASLSSIRTLRGDIDETTSDDAPATKKTSFEAYLNRKASLDRCAPANIRAAARSLRMVFLWQKLALMHVLPPTDRSSHCLNYGQRQYNTSGAFFTADEVMQSSFTAFVSTFRFHNDGPYKNKTVIKRLTSPTVAVVRPRMPRVWGRSTSDKRHDYCRALGELIERAPPVLPTCTSYLYYFLPVLPTCTSYLCFLPVLPTCASYLYFLPVFARRAIADAQAVPLEG